MNMKLFLSFSICLFVTTGTELLQAQQFQIKRYQSSEETAFSQAVVIENAAFIHTRQLLPVNSQGVIQGNSTAEQTAAVLKSVATILEKSGASKSQIIKLNIYLSAESDRTVVVKCLSHWLDKTAFPAVSFVQTRLPNLKANIGIDAIIACPNIASLTNSKNSHQQENAAYHLKLNNLGGAGNRSHISILPRGDVVYVSGQAEKGDLKQATRRTLESLLSSIRQMKLKSQNIVAIKCFVPSMEQIEIVDTQIEEFFAGEPVPAVSHVEWIAGSARPIEIEMIASAPATHSNQGVTYFTPQGMTASPVYSRVARIHGNRRIYISGLYSSKSGNGKEQTLGIFKTLDSLLKQCGSDFKHLAKATYYVSDGDASSQLNKLRPIYYDPQRPPAASKAMVKGVGKQNRTLSIDIIAAPIAAKPDLQN